MKEIIVVPGKLMVGTLHVDGERIGKIDGEPIAGPIPADLSIVLPGLVDLHAAGLERELTIRRGGSIPVESAVLMHDAVLACAGVTTALTAFRLQHVPGAPSSADLFRKVADAIGEAEKAGVLRARHFFHLRCELTDNGVVEDAEDLIARYRSQIRLISAMDHSEGQRQFKQRCLWEAAFASLVDDKPSDLSRLLTSRAEGSRLHYHDRSRKLAAIARQAGIVLASHDDDLTAHVDEAVQLGATISEFPVSETAAVAARGAGLHVVTGAPNLLRGGSHVGNVASERLIQLCAADILASDYAPGALVPSLFRLACAGQQVSADLSRAVAFASDTPARALGLAATGCLTAGARADFVRIRLWNAMPIVQETWVAGRRAA
ncbi:MULTISPECIES: alpha-D-ribose 1-methylphosphonate 5-triphosphate diphosphatase [unclassified Bradyrhizobium]|uniref:alpha-D-ribose 1-methylphosphonate 5-triphosphate diphosphatase n=1 Tax=unclassified Bradyrhizobium TaxID=2631580 RepID=UPI0029160802|nr:MULTISPECIES: alpha-D-ribose 1-methylphosphonate 5-triphosphate diphosphatase [unclassified Bradyrhizobium]